jgi:hypothetical protein
MNTIFSKYVINRYPSANFVFLDDYELMMPKNLADDINESLPIFNNFRAKLRPIYC